MGQLQPTSAAAAALTGKDYEASKYHINYNVIKTLLFSRYSKRFCKNNQTKTIQGWHENLVL